MNRIFTFGVAIFFAIVGMALLGGEKQAQAGHGCHGCNGCSSCDGSTGCDGCSAKKIRRCSGRNHDRCHGRKRDRCNGGRLFGNRCSGKTHCSGCNGGDGGEATSEKAAPEAASLNRAPLSHYVVRFRR